MWVRSPARRARWPVDRRGLKRKWRCRMLSTLGRLSRLMAYDIQHGHHRGGSSSDPLRGDSPASETRDTGHRVCQRSDPGMGPGTEYPLGVPPRILAMPRRGAINFHDGPLPRYAGLHATTWAILNQETSHGVTWHEMQEAVDTGAIVHQSIFALAEDETAFTLNRKCFRAGIESFEEVVKALGDATRRALPQSLSERTYFGKHMRPAAQACIDWTQPAEKIAALVRSLDFGPYANPLESPKVIGGGRVLLVPKLEVLPAFSERPPGTVLDVRGGSVRVATSTKQVVIPQLLTIAGEAVDIASAGITVGYRFETLPAETAARLTRLGQSVARHEEFWQQRLRQLAPLEVPSEYRRASPQKAESRATAALSVPEVRPVAGDPVDFMTAALILYLARTTGHACFDIGFGHEGWKESRPGLEQFFSIPVPVRVALDVDG